MTNDELKDIEARAAEYTANHRSPNFLGVGGAEIEARRLALDVPALCAAVRDFAFLVATLTTAARRVVNLGWGHGDDCPHRDCDTGDCCADGTMTDAEGCESPGTPCDCGVSTRDALAALLPPVSP